MNNKFIIAFDELDKLNIPDGEFNKKTNNNTPNISKDKLSADTGSSQYEKQHNTLMFLGRLKFFTSNTKAKFVFIGGHELYDAYLADVSDREYSVSSVFNGVLNVNSFLSSNQRTKSITRMAEAYLCKALIDLDYQKSKSRTRFVINKLNLKKWITAILKHFCKDNNIREQYQKEIDLIKDYVHRLQNLPYHPIDEEIYTIGNFVKEFQVTQSANYHSYSQEQFESVIHLLNQFVTYLTIRSNGAPKKLTSAFERFVRDKYDVKNSDNTESHFQVPSFFLGNKKKSKYVLAFDFYDKEMIGFTHYIAQPIINNIININSDYDDKLLVTSMFLVSHIYKHHGSGFSWRNLEYIPELITSYKTPELRGYIKDMLMIMEGMDLTSITSGIYTFKFTKSLVEDISYFSRKFEEISAFMNFSLDYFRNVKLYFRELLSSYRDNNDTKSKEVLANILIYLGDIDMAGEEYTEAVSDFKIASDMFKGLISETRTVKNEATEHLEALLIMRYTLSMLKLGLAYEKRNTFDSAYLVYNSLTDYLISYRDIGEQPLGLECSHIIPIGLQLSSERNYNDIILHNPVPYDCKSNNPDCKAFVPDIVIEEDTKEYEKWSYGNELVKNLSHHLSPDKESILSKLTVYEDLRIVYLASLAKLFSLEKQNVSGIKSDNVRLCVSEFEYMYLMTDLENKYILAVDFYRKLGDILFYKNESYLKIVSWETMFLLSDTSADIKNVLYDCMFRFKLNKDNIRTVIDWFCQELDENEIKRLNSENQSCDCAKFAESL